MLINDFRHKILFEDILWVMRLNKKRIVVLWVLSIVGWLGVIYAFSDQTAQGSAQISNPLTEKVIDLFFKNEYRSLTSSQQKLFYYQVSFFIRKTGHFLEYAILFLLICSILWVLIRKKWVVYLLSVGSCFLLAILDEFHQHFVFGRVASWKDVGIDGLGVITAYLLWITVAEIKKVRKMKYDHRHT